jgi:hypothetical protein
VQAPQAAAAAPQARCTLRRSRSCRLCPEALLALALALLALA